MDHSAIPVRYAKAFFSSAKEKNLMDTLKTDIQLVAEVCNTSKDFILFLESPIVKTSQKTSVLENIFKDRVKEITLHFLLLITQNKREAYIPAICRNFLELSRKDLNIKSAVLTTAAEVHSTTLKKIEALLAKQLNASIELKTKINPAILGGLVLRLEDSQYDASVATQLKKVKQTLLETEL